MVVARCEGWGVKWAKRYKLSYFFLTFLAYNCDYSIVTIINNTILHISKLLREKILIFLITI